MIVGIGKSVPVSHAHYRIVCADGVEETYPAMNELKGKLVIRAQ